MNNNNNNIFSNAIGTPINENKSMFAVVVPIVIIISIVFITIVGFLPEKQGNYYDTTP